MLKVKKILAVTLSTLLLCGACILVAGCEKKYDVAFKLHYVEVQDGKRVEPVLGELIFDKDTNEIHIERKYDGKEYEYFVVQYDDPKYDQRLIYEEDTAGYHWVTIFGDLYFSLWKDGEELESLCESTVCERGNYCYTYYMAYSSSLPERWQYLNTRILRLYITVI